MGFIIDYIQQNPGVLIQLIPVVFIFIGAAFYLFGKTFIDSRATIFDRDVVYLSGALFLSIYFILPSAIIFYLPWRIDITGFWYFPYIVLEFLLMKYMARKTKFFNIKKTKREHVFIDRVKKEMKKKNLGALVDFLKKLYGKAEATRAVVDSTNKRFGTSSKKEIFIISIFFSLGSVSAYILSLHPLKIGIISFLHFVALIQLSSIAGFIGSAFPEVSVNLVNGKPKSGTLLRMTKNFVFIIDGEVESVINRENILFIEIDSSKKD